MQCLFVGVGEAFDETFPNTSLYITGNGPRILLDCGFTAATAFWQHAPDPMDLDAIWISHFHGDHYFGIPALAVRYKALRRDKPLTIIGLPGVADKVSAMIELAYPGLMGKLSFPVEFIEAVPGREIEIKGAILSFASTGHTEPCQAVRLSGKCGSIFYSGDGSPTPETLKLAQGCDLIVHEAFLLDKDHPGHGTVTRVLNFAEQAKCKSLALVHIENSERKKRIGEIKKLAAKFKNVQVIVPLPGEVWQRKLQR